MSEEKKERIRRAIKGDTAALQTLLAAQYQELRNRIALQIPKNLQSHIDPEDIVQEACIAAARAISRFELRDEASFEGWLYLLTRHELSAMIRAWRAAKRGGGRPRISINGDGERDSMIALLETLEGGIKTPSRQVARAQGVSALKDALNQLPEDERQAVILVDLEGRGLAETADRMGIKYSSGVLRLRRRALERLCQLLGSPSRYLSMS